MGIQNKLKKIATPLVKAKVSQVGKRVELYTKYYKAEEVERNTILYESRDGKSLTDSPLAIFEYLLKIDLDQKYTHVWSIQSSEEMTCFSKKWEKYKNVLFVERNTSDYLKWLVKAEYLINNATLQFFVTIKKDQTYINTWHGTPLKTMGFDIPGNPSDVKNVVRNFFMADYLLSPNEHTTNMYLDSYRLRNNYQGTILEGGYPRIDATFEVNHDETIKNLHQRGIKLDLSKKVLLYTPTWKGSELSYSKGELKQINAETTQLREKFGDKYNVLIKVHPFLYPQATKFEDIVPYLIPDGMDTNKLLAMTDVLVTDYSSIFFDFLVTDKPVIFYCWDDDLYSNARGHYIPFDELPGPVAYTISELEEIIENISTYAQEYKWNYERAKRLYTSYDDGGVTKRYVDYIFFEQREVEGLKVIQQNKEKISLLIYPGGLRKNGITSSFLNLINMLDFKKYNVVCLLDVAKTAEQIEAIKEIPQAVSLLFRFGDSVYTMKEAYTDMYYHMNGVKKGNKDKFPEWIYQREVQRLLGKTHFDVSVDFSGYSLYWSKLILATSANQKLCYLHSDMLADMNRTVNGAKIHKTNVKGIISVYDRYDKLVSVSEVIRDVNAKRLSKYAEAEKFVYAENILNPKKILSTKIDLKPLVKEQTKTYLRPAEIADIDKEVTLYNRRPDSKQVVIKDVFFDQKAVMILGLFTYEGEVYAKVTQADSYLGWVKQEELVVLPDTILEERKLNNFGKLATESGSYLYSGPIGLPESEEILSLEAYRNTYVHVVKEAVTNTATSFEIVIDGSSVGWIKSNDILFSKSLNSAPSMLLKIPNKISRKLLASTTKESKNKLKELVASRSLVKAKPDKIIKTKKSYMAIINDTEVELYGSERDILTGKSITVSSVPSVEVLEILQVQSGEKYARVMWGEISVWINQSELSPDYTKGLENQNGQYIFYPDTSKNNFVTVGRLSEEKNQAAMIRAFDLYSKKDANSHLYIIGEGPERKSLEKLIKELSLESSVTLTGQISRPYPFMKKCQTFVLTSLYEGQSIVLLEALTLGMTVISTDIPACRQVLENGKFGYLTETNDPEGIYKSMLQSTNKNQSFKKFDVARYNMEAIQALDRLLSVD